MTSNIQSKIIRHAKNQELTAKNKENNQWLKTNTELMQC